MTRPTPGASTDASTGNFSLPSLAVSCSYDEPALPVTLPAKLEDRTASIAVLEGAFRPNTRLCRFVRPEGLIGLQLPDPLPDRIRVALRLISDPQGERRWIDRQVRRGEVSARRSVVTELDSTIRGRHRLLRVSAQGRLRGNVILAAPRDETDSATQRIVFEVESTEIDASRLLLISLGGARGVPEWNSDRRLPEALVGVSAVWARVAVGDGAPRALLSSGRPSADGWQPWSPEIGYACVNRTAHAARLTVSSADAPEQAKGGRRLFGLGRRDPAWPEAVEVAEAGGGTRVLELPARAADGTAAVVLPGGSTTSFVRLLGLPDRLERPVRLRTEVVAG